MMDQLFPDLRPNRQGWLEVGRGHSLHWETSGNPSGEPVVWLHGGPGSASSPLHRRVFDPKRFHIVQFDQRGCGLSRPSGDISHNQTQDLVEDIERLRQFLEIPSWIVVGGSWGGALALAYAQQHAKVIRRLLLRSTFLCSKQEIERFMQHPPEACRQAWENLMRLVPQADQNLLAYGYRVFCVENEPREQATLALAWARFESAMNAYPLQAPSLELGSGALLVPRYRVQCHYLAHGCFTDSTSLLDPAALAELKTVLVHGEDDAVCPIANSLAIKAAVPEATFLRVPSCGHDLTHPAMLGALVQEIAGWSSVTTSENE